MSRPTMHANQRHQIIRNGHKTATRLSRAGGVRAGQHLSLEQVLQLLDAAAAPARGEAQALLRLLARQPWRIDTETGSGDGGVERGIGQDRQVTLLVGARRYRLHCRQTPDLRLGRISA